MFIKGTEQQKYLEKIKTFSLHPFMEKKTIHLEKKQVILITVLMMEHLIKNT